MRPVRSRAEDRTGTLAFGARTVPAQLAERRDPWSASFTRAQDLLPALEKARPLRSAPRAKGR